MSDPAADPANAEAEAKKKTDAEAKAAKAPRKSEPPPDGPVSAEEAAAIFGLEPGEVFAAARRAGRVTAVTVDARKLREGEDG